MSEVDSFLANDQMYDGLFRSPVCRDFEPRFSRIFEKAKRNADGIYLLRNTHIVAELREVEIEGISCSGKFEGVAIVKNPHRNEFISERLNLGLTNAIVEDRFSGVIFAGKVVDQGLVRVLRPVTAKYQDQFREQLRLTIPRSDIIFGHRSIA